MSAHVLRETKPGLPGVFARSMMHVGLLQIYGVILFEVVLVATLLMIAVAGLVKSQGANIRRYVSIIVFALVAGVVGYYVFAFNVDINKTGGFSDFVLLAYGNMTLMIVLVQVCLYVFPYERWSMQIVDFGYYAADTVIGLVLFGVLFLLSIVQLVDSLQALLLFSSELLIESRRGAQVRLFDQKFGDVRVDGSGPPPNGLRPSRPAATPGSPVPVPAAVPSTSSGADAQAAPAVLNPWRNTHAANYGTVGAQLTITDSRPLRTPRNSIWRPRINGGDADAQPQPPQSTYRPPV